MLVTFSKPVIDF